MALMVFSLNHGQSLGQQVAASPTQGGSATEAGKAKPVLTNQTIVSLVARGVPDKTILLYMHTYPVAFVIKSSAQLMQLHTQDHIATSVLIEMARLAHDPAAMTALTEYLKVAQGGPDNTPQMPAQPNSPAHARPAATGGLTNQDVYDLAQQKVPDASILKIIQSSRTDFSFSKDTDFEVALKSGLSLPVIKAMILAAGPSAETAARQYDVRLKQQAVDAQKARTADVADFRATVHKECPRCVSIAFFRYDARTNRYLAGVSDDLAPETGKFTNQEYAFDHHIVVTNDPAKADYFVIWSDREKNFFFTQANNQWVTTSDGGVASVYTGTTSGTTTQTYWNMKIIDRNNKELYSTKHANIGLWLMHKGDVDCWHDAEKFLSRLGANDN